MFKGPAVQFRIISLVGGFLLIPIGLLFLRQRSFIIGFLLIGLGIAGFLWSSLQLQKKQPTAKELHGLRLSALSALFVVLSFSCALLVLYLTTGSDIGATRGYLASVGWVASLVLLVAVVLLVERSQKPKRASKKNWWIKNRTEVLTITALIVVAGLARTVDLPSHPYPWSGDEASIGIEGQRILKGEVTNFFDTGWSGQPNWSFVPTAITLTLFGENIFAIRMASALVGILSVVFVYLLGREMFNRNVGLLAAGFLALFPLHVHFSRIGVNNVNDSLMVVFVLWLVFRAIRTGRGSDYALAGIASGLTIYTYVGTRLVLVIAVGTLVYIGLTRRGFLKKNLEALGVFSIAFALTTAPMAYYFIRHPDIFINRIGQEGILFNGWLAQHAAQTGQSIGAILLEQLSLSTMVFIAHGAPGNFFSSPGPYLSLLGSLLFLLGMAYSFSRVRERQHVVLLGWFWSVVILGGALTLNPPSNTRMLMTTPAVALFIGLGLWQLGELLQRLNASAWVRSVAIAAFVALLSLESGLFYFNEYRSNYYFQDASAELAMEAGLQLQQLGPNYSLFLFGSPRVFSDFPTISFLAPENIKTDPTSEGIANITLAGDQSALFIFIPENYEAMDLIEERFPGGVRSSVMRLPNPVEVLYYSYAVSP